MNTQKYLIIVGNNVKQLRQRRGLSQEGLAEKASVSRSTIQAVEKGKNIELEHILNIAVALNINPANLFLTEEERHEVTYQAKLFWDEINALRKITK